ncbi:hypothetical protein [Hufsiella ginkgonis]|uniref:DUF3078 domain-containing protein n=1 Tax=Hufsiella ginkgonis TaxID=2695274 RepID=A0A7K1XSW5_9SPHI|nr:hypothetical protein [Hufsiella ginkgonis]MXV14093.1 hypothetical protein [Hufsiella ginkgonis]
MYSPLNFTSVRNMAAIVLAIAGSFTAAAQVPAVQLPSPMSVNELQKLADTLLSDPATYNDAYAKFLSGVATTSPQLYKTLRDLNVNFKTFEATGQPAALGLDYSYQNSWTKTRVTGNNAGFQSYTLNFEGNIAYRKANNPANLLQSTFTYTSSFLHGGKTQVLTPAERARYTQISDSAFNANVAGNMALAKTLDKKAIQFIQTSNQYYIGINGNFSYETNQDFSRQQFVPGVLVNLGARPWNRNEALLYFNLPDYPFALIRLLTGTSDSFKLSPASFPSGLIGIDHVMPGQDSVRRALTGNLNAYNRFRCEFAFKTQMAQIGTETLFFSADYRYYRELNAVSAIKKADMAKYGYFTAAIAATNGFFISYASGKLPFDQRNSNTYGLGIHYNLGNFKR